MAIMGFKCVAVMIVVAALAYHVAAIRASLRGNLGEADPSYDHQTTTYTTKFEPVYVDNSVSVTPFFSPDHSIDTITDFIASVSVGGTVDIGTPGFGSWSGCTPFQGCSGCNISAMSQEAFPVFHAILNAVHVQGATVRLLTNNYNTPTCPGKVSPLDFLALNGVQVKYFDTVTFMHAKFITVDGKRSAVSSVNWSYTSFMLNREAGVIIGEGGEDMVAFAMEVYDADWAQATDYVVTNTYTPAEMAQITNPAYQPLNIPRPRYFEGAYVTPTPYPAKLDTSLIYTSPDFANTELFNDINGSTTSFHLMMYQITDMELCAAMKNIYENKPTVDLRILVSAVIFDPTDCSLAQQCYQILHDAGVTIYTTPSYYSYSHQKFWIVDGEHVGMSTGNWSPSDYPEGTVFPPHGQMGWQKVNRDYTMRMWGQPVVSQFQNVMDQDQERGSTWAPPGQTCNGQ